MVGARERRSVKEGAAEAPKVEQALRGSVERNAHAVEHEDDVRRGVAHALHGRLIREKVAAVNRLFEVHLRRVAFAARIHAGVDAALGACGVGPAYGDKRKEIHGNAGFAELDDGHQSGETSTDDDAAADFAGAATRSEAS